MGTATPSPSPNTGNALPQKPSNTVNLVNRTFECEFYIVDQANSAYDDPTSAEYEQASIIVRNAVSITHTYSKFKKNLNTLIVKV